MGSVVSPGSTAAGLIQPAANGGAQILLALDQGSQTSAAQLLLRLADEEQLQAFITALCRVRDRMTPVEHVTFQAD